MRLLFAGLASPGHTYPLVPLAVAARDAGHEVHFAAGEAVHAPLAAVGLRPFRPASAFYEMYTEDLEPELERLRPDLVVHGWGVPGAAVAARRAGIAGVWHGFGRMYGDGIGLELPARVDGASGRPHLDICPPSLQDPAFLSTARRIPLRPVPFSPPGGPTDGPTGGPITGGTAGLRPGGRPLVYLTLGTAFGTPELLTTAIEALSRLRVRVVAATGRVRPEELGPLPGDVVVRAWVAQADLLPHAAVVVHHGGSGTTLGALAAGVPQLLLPQGADQFTNAGAVVAPGAGLCLLPGEAGPEAIAAHVRTLLADGGHREAARGVAAEIAAMPGPDEVARRLPDLARA